MRATPRTESNDNFQDQLTPQMRERLLVAKGRRHAPGSDPRIDTLMNMLILLGAAVQDSALGNDVYRAFLVRMALFLLVAAYALLAMYVLEWWRQRVLLR